MADAAPATVWITGASSGLGEALAREYAACGARVLLSARSAERLAALAAELGEGAHAYPADVTDRAQLARAIAAMAADGHRIDLAILNAGSYHATPLAEFDSAAIGELLTLNVLGVTNAIELLLPALRAQARGHIAVMGSLAADIGLPYAGGYSASKAALLRLCQSLRPEMEAAGLRISIIEPGFVRTPLTARNDFPMPFLLDAPDAARLIRRCLARGDFRVRFPRALAFATGLLAALPESWSLPLRRRMLRR